MGCMMEERFREAIERERDKETAYLCGIGLKDISFLAHNTSITRLEVMFNHIDDLSPLEFNTTLTSLDIGYNKIHDLSPLQTNTTLTTFTASGNPIADLSPLKFNTTLTSLRIDGTNVENIDALRHNTTIKYLSISGTFVTDLSPLRRNPTIERLFPGNWDEIGEEGQELFSRIWHNSIRKSTTLRQLSLQSINPNQKSNVDSSQTTLSSTSDSLEACLLL